jgi:hypothetical protein
MSDDVIEFPELKKVSKKRITIFDEELALIYDMTPKQKVNYLICLVAFLFIVGAISLLFLGRLSSRAYIIYYI